MDQATGEVQAASAASWDAWDNYYKEASRRRRVLGGGRRLMHESKRRRRIRERLGLVGSFALLGGLMFLFYLVLTH